MNMRKETLRLMGHVALLVSVALGLSGSSSLLAQELAEFEKKVTEFVLDNGLKFLIIERHEAPVVSFHTYADVGSVNELKGITGMAHLFEHMAFKGTRTVGTTNYEAEAEALEEVDRLFQELKKERRRGEQADQEKLARLEEHFRKAQEKASEHIVSDEFEEAFTLAGAVGLNASTSQDSTHYVVSLPSNKIELWMSLESDRFLNPVLREFYREKAVVMEERRQRVESQPFGRLLEEFLAVAYKAHPYGEPVIGHMSDLETITRPEARAFFETYYSSANLTIAIAGDVDPTEVQRLAQTYFGRIPKRPEPDPVETVEPPQLGEKRLVIEDPSQPFLLIGYHKSNIMHPDNAVFEAITDILGIGRTSRLYEGLVKEKKIAVNASAFQGFPGSKFPGLFLFYAVPARGHTPQACETAIEAEIERLKREPVSAEELRKAKTRSRASLIRSLASNRGLARELTFYEVLTGDWRNLFRQLDDIEKVSAEDIQRVANEYFIRKNRTVAMIETRASGSREETK